MPSSLDIKTVGVLGNGQVDDAPTLQKALQQARANNIPHVRIPEGHYRIGSTLRVPNGVHIQADDHAVIKLAENAGVHQSTFLLTNADQENGRDITIEGGIWDGNNPQNPRGPDGPKNSYTGVTMNFIKVHGLTLRNLTVYDAESFFIRLGEVEDFTIEDITFKAPHVRLNHDGIHVGGFCHRGVIRRIKAIGINCPNDDMVAINANDDVTRAINLGMKEGPISQIQVEDLQADDAYTFVRLLSQDAPIEDIHIRGIRGGCRYYAINLNRWRFPIGKGRIARVQIEDVLVAKNPSPNNEALVHITLAVQDLLIKNLQRKADGRPEVPTLEIANATPCQVSLEGLTPQQITTLKQASTADISAIDSRLKIEMTQESRLVLRDGGFAKMKIETG